MIRSFCLVVNVKNTQQFVRVTAGVAAASRNADDDDITEDRRRSADELTRNPQNVSKYSLRPADDDHDFDEMFEVNPQ